jgi:ribosomal protein S18 acetylase RimI-like enzyme
MTIRPITVADLAVIARFEREIATISFRDEAVVAESFHRQRVEKAIPRDAGGMLVLEIDGSVNGWLWMGVRTNSITKDRYVDFKSFYITEPFRGTEWPDRLMEAGLAFARERRASRIVGRLHVENVPMRLLYKKHCFVPTHLTMELQGN